MNARLVLMPCLCRIHLDQNIALKEVSVVDKNTEIVILKIECWYCHKVRRIKMGISHFYELFWTHQKEVYDGRI
jgi:hypothetical protein